MLAPLALQARDALNVKALKITKEGGNAVVSFVGVVDRSAVAGNGTLTLSPVISSGSDKGSPLPQIIIRGSSVIISDQRREMSGRPTAYPADAIMTTNGETFNYRASVPFESWMEGSTLRLDRTLDGCCSTRQLETTPLAANLLSGAGAAGAQASAPAVAPVAPAPEVAVAPAPEVAPAPAPEVEVAVAPTPAPVVAVVPTPEPTPAPEVAPAPAPQRGTFVPYVHRIEASVGDNLSANNPYISRHDPSTGSFNPSDVNVRENALVIYFPQGQSTIDMSFSTNGPVLRELTYALNAIGSSADSKLSNVIIAGFASIEGRFLTNQVLAGKRAEAFRNYVATTAKVPASAVQIYNGAEDWDGLRKLVAASDMPRKADVLRIIDTVPIWDAKRNLGREGELMRLAGGDPYRYMLANFFPKQRNAAYIKVLYENVHTDETADAINRAVDLINKNDYIQALAILWNVKGDARSYNPIGASFMMTGDLASAKEFLDRAVANGDSDAQNNLDQITGRMAAR